MLHFLNREDNDTTNLSQRTQNIPMQTQNQSNFQNHRVIQKKSHYQPSDINCLVRLLPDLTVILVKYGREYHYKCTKCNYHIRINKEYNKNHQHERYQPVDTTNQTKITDFTETNQDGNKTAQICVGLLSVLTRTSLYALSQPDTQDIIHRIAEIGFSYKENHPDSKSLPSNITQYSSKTLSSSIASLDSCIACQILKIFHETMVNMYIDAGTVNSIHSIEFLISTSNIAPYPYSSIFTDCYTTHQKYFDHILTVYLQLIRETGAIPISIIGDSLPAQRKVLYEDSAESIQSQLENQDILEKYNITEHEKKIIQGISYIPCLNHVLHLALDDSLNNISVLAHSFSILNKFEQLLKHKDIIRYCTNSKLKIRFRMCRNRWVYVYDSACYILKNRKSFVKILESNQKLIQKKFDELSSNPFDPLLTLVILFEPFKIFSNTIETNNFLLTEFKPRLAEVIHELKQIGERFDLKVTVQSIIEILYDRLTYTARYDLIEAAFCLSPIGKYYFMKSRTKKPNYYEDKYCLTDDSEEIYSFLEIITTFFAEKGLTQSLSYRFMQFPHLYETFQNSEDNYNSINSQNNSTDINEDNFNEEEEDPQTLDYYHDCFLDYFNHCEQVYQLFDQYTEDKLTSFLNSKKSDSIDMFNNLVSKFAEFYTSLINICKSEFFQPSFSNWEEIPFNIIYRHNDIKDNDNIPFHDFIAAIQTTRDILLFIHDTFKNSEFTFNYSSQYSFFQYCCKINDFLSSLDKSLERFSSSINKFCVLVEDKDDSYIFLLKHYSPQNLTLKLIQKKAKIIDIDVTLLTTEFLNWNSDDRINYDIGQFSLTNPIEYWEAHTGCRIYKTLAQVAPYFIKLCCSEAVVERIFSKRKNFLNPHYTNIKNQTLFTKIRLESGVAILKHLNQSIDLNSFKA